MNVNDAVAVYHEILVACVPIAVVFGIGNLITSTILRVAFGGRLHFKGGE